MRKRTLPALLSRALRRNKRRRQSYQRKSEGHLHNGVTEGFHRRSAEWLQASKLNAKQRAMLQAVAEEYANNLPPLVAQERLDRIKKAGTNVISSGPAGKKRRSAYYRIAGPDFLIEYDNTQNNATISTACGAT